MDKKFFAEYVQFFEEEREEAKAYLESWKKFLVRKLTRDSFDIEVLDEQWNERSPEFSGALCQTYTLALKLHIKIRLRFEIGYP